MIPAEIAELQAEREAELAQQKAPLILSEGLKEPPNYRITKSATYIVSKKDDGSEDKKEIAHAGLYIESRARDINSSHEKWQLVITRGDEQKTITIDRGTAQSATKLVELASYGVPVNSANSREIVRYLAAFEATNYKELPTTLTSSKMGWQSTGGYLLGVNYHTTSTEHVRYEPDDESTRGLAKAFTTKGRMAEWLRILKPAMVKSNHAQIAFYSAFIPPLLDTFGCPNFIVDFAHRTSKGKTTTLRIAASVVGVPDEKQEHSALATWDATPIYIERHLAAINGLPFVVDDTKRAKRPEDVARVLYTAAQGRGKGRGRPNGIAQTGTWRTVTISSGEQPATSFTNDGGTRGRVLEITGSPFPDGSSTLVNSLNSGLMEHYGHGYAVFIPWLVKNVESHKEEWQTKYKASRDRFTERSSDNVGARLAAYIAAIYATAEIVHQAFDESSHPLPWYREHFDEQWESILQEAGDDQGDAEALRDVFAWVQMNANKFYGRGEGNAPMQGYLGKWDIEENWPYIAVTQPALMKFLSDAGYAPKQVLSAWRENGVIETRKGRGYTINVKLGRQQASLIVIKREAVDKLNEVQNDA